jgi:cyclic-di-GMP phosphodiesterase TipF (flagellum assembly factor)
MAMAVVALSLGVLLHQLGAPVVVAAMVGGLVLALFWLSHQLKRRRRRVSVLEREISRLGAELYRVRSGGRAAPMPRQDEPQGAGEPLAPPPPAVAQRDLDAPNRTPFQPELPLGPAAASALPDFEAALSHAAAHAKAEAEYAGGDREAHVGATTTDARSPFDFVPPPIEPRSLAERQAEIGAALATGTGAATPPPLSQPAARAEPRLEMPEQPTGPSDYDVEMIQGLIRKLAAEVNAAEAARQSPQARSEQPNIESSLEALRVTADTMRDVSKPPPPAFGRRKSAPAPIPSPAASFEPAAPWLPMPAVERQPVGPMHARLAALAEAITARRADVLLEPILGLEDHRPRHYEVSLRLRDAAGGVLDTDGALESLRAAGLLPVLDATRMARTAQVARRLRERGKTGAVFSEVDGDSLTNDQFLRDFSEAYGARDAFSGQLVLTLAQSAVRRFTRRDWMVVDDLRDLGFQFALQDVTDLDMDFEGLRGHGFAFVKLDADVFLHGLPAPAGTIPASDICRHLAELGLTLIVGAIEDETRLAQVFGFGVLYGQGRLFGGPRPMKAEALAAATRPLRGGGYGDHAAA